MTYVVSDLQFVDTGTGTRISYETALFHHSMNTGSPLTPAALEAREVGAFDGPSQSFQVGNPIAPGSRVITLLAGSTLFQHGTWTGWRRFRGAITYANFKTALASLKKKSPAFKASDNPADYELTQWHLNAELKFGAGPAELGWSMRHAKVALLPSAKLPLP